jgi:hypothetical protein
MKELKDCEGECPKCGSMNVGYGSMQIDGNSMHYPGNCGDCDTDFKEWYSIEYVDSEYEKED